MCRGRSDRRRSEWSCFRNRYTWRSREYRSEESTSESIRKYWTSLRFEPQFETNLDKNLSGISGGLIDVAKTVVETYVGTQFAGTIGAVIVLGVELGSATGVTFSNPNILAGVTVGGGILILFGPSAIIPALAAGVVTAALADIRFLTDE